MIRNLLNGVREVGSQPVGCNHLRTYLKQSRHALEVQGGILTVGETLKAGLLTPRAWRGNAAGSGKRGGSSASSVRSRYGAQAPVRQKMQTLEEKAGTNHVHSEDARA